MSDLYRREGPNIVIPGNTEDTSETGCRSPVTGTSVQRKTVVNPVQQSDTSRRSRLIEGVTDQEETADVIADPELMLRGQAGSSEPLRKIVALRLLRSVLKSLLFPRRT